MAGDWVLDTGLGVLITDVLALPGCTVKRSEIGTVGDRAHQARTSKHNPEHPPPPGNPDNEVDAVDLPHAPDRGLDCAEVTEALRLSRDPRLYLVIFDGRQFSSYVKDGIPAFTWRPYSGDDMHRTHAHVEVNDTHHGDTSHWKVTTMSDFTAEEVKAIRKALTGWNDYGDPRTECLETGRETLRFGANVGKPFWLTRTVNAIAGKLDTLLAREPVPPVVQVSMTDAQVEALAGLIVQGLRGKLSVDFVPQGTGE
jgi:hypothetical protein